MNRYQGTTRALQEKKNPEYIAITRDLRLYQTSMDYVLGK
jgi:hypothetical protein